MNKTATMLLTALVVLLSAASLQAQTRTVEPDARKLFLLEQIDKVNGITGDAELSSKLVEAAAAQTSLLLVESTDSDGRAGLDAGALRLIFSRIANNLAQLTVSDRLTLKDLNRLRLYGIDGLAYLCEGTSTEQKSMLKAITGNRVRAHMAAEVIADGIIRKHDAQLEKEKAKGN